jgi:hypothetical protein
MSKSKYRQSDDPELVSVEKQAAVEADQPAVEAPVPQPIVATSPVVAQPVKKTPMYVLFINDEVVRVGTGKAPNGSWYALYIDLSTGKAYGPFPMLVKTSKGVSVLTGFVLIENLVSMARPMLVTLSKGGWKEPISPVHLEDCEHKFMSSVIYL